MGVHYQVTHESPTQEPHSGQQKAHDQQLMSNCRFLVHAMQVLGVDTFVCGGLGVKVKLEMS
jgi:hypothetical protein